MPIVIEIALCHEVVWWLVSVSVCVAMCVPVSVPEILTTTPVKCICNTFSLRNALSLQKFYPIIRKSG